MKQKTTYSRHSYSKALNKRLMLTFILALACSTFSFSQITVVGGPIPADGPACEFPAIFNPNNQPISIPSAVTISEGSRGAACASINVIYTGFTPQAEAAFQYAVDIWANTIESAVPITINANYIALPPNVLGGAGPSNFYQLTGGDLLPNTIFPSALAEKLVGTELSGANSEDIFCQFSNSINWYFGTDANPPNNQFDFVSVVLHELGHGLGFIGFSSVTGNEGSITNQGFLAPYDNFTENGGGTDLTLFPDPSGVLFAALTGGDLFINSPIATAANGGVLPQIWAPSTYSPGSSYSHWDDNVFPNSNENSLMTFQIGNGQANHNTGPITRGLFQEFGWTLCGTLNVNEFALESLQIAPNPFNEDIRITLPGNYNDSDFNISIYDVNGRVVLEKDVLSSNSVIDLNVSELTTSIYFMQIKDAATGLSVTKKIIRQ